MQAGFGRNNAGDSHGKIRLIERGKGVVFKEQIGEENLRIGEINIERGVKADFEENVYAKKIQLAAGDIEFRKKLDMQYRNDDVIDTGNIEFVNLGKIKIHKDFTGNIITDKADRGEVTFVETPDIYEIGSQNKKISSVTFEGNHEHNLHNNIHAKNVNLDAGTYNVHTNSITINGNTVINGSTLDLRRNLTFNGDVDLSGNITINALGGYGLVLSNLPNVALNTNIVIRVNGAFPANDTVALSVLRRENGEAFVPDGYNYNPATGNMVLQQGGQVQQAGVQAVARPAHAQARLQMYNQAQQIQAEELQAQVNALALQEQQVRDRLVQLTQQHQQARDHFQELSRQRREERERVGPQNDLLNASFELIEYRI